MPTWIKLLKTLGKKLMTFLMGVQPFPGWTFSHTDIYDFDNFAESVCIYCVLVDFMEL